MLSTVSHSMHYCNSSHYSSSFNWFIQLNNRIPKLISNKFMSIHKLELKPLFHSEIIQHSKFCKRRFHFCWYRTFRYFSDSFLIQINTDNYNIYIRSERIVSIEKNKFFRSAWCLITNERANINCNDKSKNHSILHRHTSFIVTHSHKASVLHVPW